MGTMEGILKDAMAKSPAQLVTFIVYDLPNRDCHAKASNGEICCTYKEDGRCDYTAAGTCSEGLEEYKTKYIDKIKEVLKKYDGLVPIVLVIEPDSLPNLSTNQADPRCGNVATKTAYKEGVAYAVSSIKEAAPNVAIYLDAGHGGWLGWKNNMQDFVDTIKSLGVSQHLRGFATNVAGYQSLGTMCPTYDFCLNNANPGHACCYDPCGLTSEWNPSHNEHNYALHLRKAMSEGIQGFEPHVIIDTGRNGVANMRSDCANWCNIRGAGVGLIPTTKTANTSIIDAYFWLKTPGESDGCSQTLPDGGLCPRFDADCGSADSLGSESGEPRAPEAGQWFDFQIKQLAANAKLHATPAFGMEAPALIAREVSGAAADAPVRAAANKTWRLLSGANPFEGPKFYVNPTYAAELGLSIESAEGAVKGTLKEMRDVPSAYWLDVKTKITGEGTGTMEGILKDAMAKSPAQLVTFIVYDLPNRDRL